MYSFDSRIRYSEIDKDGHLKLESMIDYFQDCSTFQTQESSADIAYMKERGIAWVLNSWQIDIKRFPALCEEVTIGTRPYDMKGFFGYRNYYMDSKEGERLAVANSVWTLFDFVKGVPSRITPEMMNAYPIDEKLDMDYGSRKIVIPADAEAVRGPETLIRTHHLDTNNHVNNGQYVRMAIEACEGDSLPVRGLRAEYKRQALLGDVLYPDVYMNVAASGEGQESKDIRIVDLKDADGRSVSTIELTF